MAIHGEIPGLPEDQGDPTGVIVVPMTQHEDIGGTQIDAEHSDVVVECTSLPGIKEDTSIVGLNPHCETMLGKKPFAGTVVDQKRNPDIS
jgi:hypothetical protein